MSVGIIGLGDVGLPLDGAFAELVLDFRGVTRGIEVSNLVRL